ncbi:MAG: hypothetical protein ACOCXP_04245, partial [Candidatus Dojkabacteria bacterium]
MSTPMQKQFDEIKQKYPDYVVLFRLGDFYETFDEDAKTCAKVLGITLTARGQGENRRAMAGVPHHALKNYLPKLVKAGVKTVIVDQVSQPEPGKIVERAVTDVITPGAIIDEQLATGERNNYLAVLNIYSFRGKTKAAVVLFDLGTSDSLAVDFAELGEDLNELIEFCNKYQVKEIVLPDHYYEEYKSKFSQQNFTSVKVFSKQIAADFKQDRAMSELKEEYKLNSFNAWGLEDKSDILGALNALRIYAKESLNKDIDLSNFKVIKEIDYVNVPWSSYKALDVFYDSNGGQTDSLFNYLNKTCTSSGSRLLSEWLLRPSMDAKLLEYRYKSQEEIKNTTEKHPLVEFLEQQVDYERFSVKYNYNRILPSHLYALAIAIKNAKHMQDLISGAEIKYEGALGEFLKLDLSKLE